MGEAQERARRGEIGPEQVADAAVAALPEHAAGLRPVINATGVLLHTNLGRAPLSAAAVAAVGRPPGSPTSSSTSPRARGRGGDGARWRRSRAAVPQAEAVHVVNNNAAALVLAATALAAGREIVLSRGEMVEIGDGFRIPELL